jgi:ATP-dependent helicase/nuclease subunit B
MPILLTAPTGAGKTETVIREILQHKARQPWQPIWVLLPNELQIQGFRERLITAQRSAYASRVLFGVEYFTFYKLYSHLLDRMLLPQRELQQGSVYRILRHLIADLNQQGMLKYFHPIAHKPGFIKLVAEFIYELKQAQLLPGQFSHYARQTGSPKDIDLATIYGAYQDWVTDHDVVDREGAGWLALAHLQDRGQWLHSIRLLVVDGFQQFSPLQVQLLAGLASRVQDTILTLSYEAERATTVYRGFARTLERVQQTEVAWEVYALPVPDVPDRHAILHHLQRNLLNPNAEPIAAVGAVHLIEAPDAEQEVRGVLKQVKALLLAGAAPESILILAHDLQRYSNLLRAAATPYGLRLAFRQGIQLMQNPPVKAVLTLLDLHTPETNFRRQDVLDVLRSPYFKFPQFRDDDVNTLERLSLKFKVIYSRQDWQNAIRQAREARPDEEGETPIVPGNLDDLDRRLNAFFDDVTPPETTTMIEFIAWLEGLLGPDPGGDAELDLEALATPDGAKNLNFYQQTRAVHPITDSLALEASQTMLAGDLQAMHDLRRCWLDLLNGYELLGQASEPIGREIFRKELQSVVEQRVAESGGGVYRQHRVLVTTPFEARGLPHDHVLILGLAEGLFPAQRHEDPLYSNREREALNIAHGTELLQISTERQDDTALFYECLALARQSLTLSRPTLDEKANPWPESVLWRAVTALVPDAERRRYRAGQAPRLYEAATLREASIALADSLQNGSEYDLGLLSAIYQWLSSYQEQNQRWRAVVRGRAIEQRRADPKEAFDHYAGVLRDPDLIARVAAALGPSRLWSATQFNDYGYCPFRFFSKRLLKLEALEEPIEGFDAKQLGTLQHEILERTYRQIQEEGLAVRPEHGARALEVMEAIADEVFDKAPHELGFRITLLWKQEQAEIRQRLRALIWLDFGRDPDSPFVINPRSRQAHPVAAIAARGERYVHGLEVGFGQPGQPLRATGSIDRIDRVDNTLILLDYKSGSKTPTNDDLERGRNFQMMLYLEAARQLVKEQNLEVAAGMFWSIRKRDTGGEISATDERLVQAQRQLHAYILDGRRGRFPIEPRKVEASKCFKYCEFNKFCRVQHTRAYEDADNQESEGDA